MSLTRREFIVGTTLVSLSPSLLASTHRTDSLKIGILTDAHFAESDTRGTRHYRESIPKLKEAVKVFKDQGVDLAVEIGDFIDAADSRSRGAELAFLRQIDHQFMKVGVPRLYVLGNHCVYSLSKKDFLNTVGQESSFSSRDVNGWHIVTLDACHRKDEVSYDKGNYDWTDTEIPEAQREWLQSDLERTENPTIVFVHQRIDLDKPSPYAVHSAIKVREILSKSGRVAAVFQGHSHTNEHKKIDGVDYVTLGAMVEGSGEENNSYSVLQAGTDRTLKLVGYRKHEAHPFSS